jgi:hypothetical protein
VHLGASYKLCKSVFNEMVRKDDSFWNYKEHVSSLINQPDVNFGINIKEFNDFSCPILPGF